MGTKKIKQEKPPANEDIAEAIGFSRGYEKGKKEMADLHAEVVKERDELDGVSTACAMEIVGLKRQLAAAEERERGLRELVAAATDWLGLALDDYEWRNDSTQEAAAGATMIACRAALAAHPREATAVADMPPVREVGKDSGGAVYGQYITDTSATPPKPCCGNRGVKHTEDGVYCMSCGRSAENWPAPVALGVAGEWEACADGEYRADHARYEYRRDDAIGAQRRPLTSKQPHDTIP